MSAMALVPVQAGSIVLDGNGGSADAVAAVENAIRDFESQFSLRAGCLGSATVTFEVLAGRKGEYRTASATVVINPERPVASMAATVYHELAHHAMVTCRLYRDADFTGAFYGSQGLPAERGWFDTSAGWSEVPAEHFAEAVAVMMTGSGGQIGVTSEAIEVVRLWINSQDFSAAAISSASVSTTESGAAAPGIAEVAIVEPVPPVSQVGQTAPLSQPATAVVLSVTVQASGEPVGDPAPLPTARWGWIRPV